ncbi:MAG: sensor histidine kinase [Ardenticatenaceae bacterium]
MNIKTKLTLAFLLIAWLSLAATTLVSYAIAREALTKQVFNHLESVGVIQEHRVSAIVAQNLQRLSLVASRTQLRLSLAEFLGDEAREHQERMNKILLDALSSIPDFRAIHVLTLHGTVAASTDSGMIGKNQADQEFFVRGQQESNADLFFLDDKGHFGAYLSGPLRLDDQRLGVMVIETDIENIIALVSDYSGLGETGETFLAKRDENGDALFLAPLRFDASAALSRTVAQEDLKIPMTQALLKNEQFFADGVDYRGEPVLAATRYLPETDWGLVVKIDQAEALAPVTNMRNLLAALIVVSSFGVVILSLVVARSITRPLINLTLVASRISNGDLSQRADVTTHDEIGGLAQTFNKMTATLTEDIAKRKRTEKKLAEQAEELARSNGDLEQFAYVVSHDLRAPLRALKAYSQFLEEDCAEQLDEVGLEYIEGIGESAQQMDDLVVDLLEYSRIGRIKVELSQVDVNELLERLVTSLHLRDQAEVRLPNDAPIVQARAVRLEQIFANLLSNAIKFGRPNVPPLITVSWADYGDNWAFSVQDNGIGIREKQFEKIFGIFQRLHTVDEFEGTGIGLAIVKKAVSEHNGQVTVESTVGEGSTFTFTLPKQGRGGEG